MFLKKGEIKELFLLLFDFYFFSLFSFLSKATLVTEMLGKVPNLGQLIHFSRVTITVKQMEQTSTGSWKSDSAPPCLWIRQRYFHGLLFPIIRIFCTSVGLLSEICPEFLNFHICLCDLVWGFAGGEEMR